MLDFNDTPSPQERNQEAEREEIRAELLARLESVLRAMFPEGKKRRGKFLSATFTAAPVKASK